MRDIEEYKYTKEKTGEEIRKNESRILQEFVSLPF